MNRFTKWLFYFKENIKNNKLPTKVFDRPWVVVTSKGNNDPVLRAMFDGGKWCIFMPKAIINQYWIKIRKATKQGLFSSSKCSTSCETKFKYKDSVICVYNDDWKDEAEIMRIRNLIRELIPVDTRMHYKKNEDSMKGVYSVNGHKDIALYRDFGNGSKVLKREVNNRMDDW